MRRSEGDSHKGRLAASRRTVALRSRLANRARALPRRSGWLLALLLIQVPVAGADETVRFARDIQPLLATRCLKCHGPDTQEAGLDLTQRESLESAGLLEPLAPDAADEQPLLSRLRSQDPDWRMPPDGESLTAGEIDRIAQWIQAGATWEAHWAYQPLEPVAIPELPAPDLAAWAVNPVDALVARRLHEQDLAPSSLASRRTRLRRLSLDTRGVTPQPWEITRFLEDERPDAWQRQVDRWLASPRFGERWARHWMDWVHFAETHGHDQDRPREHAWPYRDYLIRSFNADRDYGEFVRQQIAGDALAPTDPDAIVATGFLAAGPWDESSLRDIQENSIDRVIGQYLDRDDIVTTVMSTFASTSIHCARCHDHKFDPISQREYYALQAVFAGVDKADRPYDPDPEVARQRHELTQALKQAESWDSVDPEMWLTRERMAQVAAWEAEQGERESAWQTLGAPEVVSRGGATWTQRPDGAWLASGAVPDKDITVIVGTLPLERVTGIRLQVLPDESLPAQGPGRAPNGNLHVNEIRVFVASQQEPARWTEVALGEPRADFNQEGWGITAALDQNPNTAWGIFPEVGRPHQAWLPCVAPLEPEQAHRLRVELHQIHGGAHLIGSLQVEVTSVAPESVELSSRMPGELREIVRRDAALRTREEQARLAAWVESEWIRGKLQKLPPVQWVYAGSNDFEPQGSFRPVQTPRTVQVLNRGQVTQPVAEAQPGALSCVSALSPEFQLDEPQNEAARRIAFARWLTSPDNPLTWRSMANRLWLVDMGRGLVTTPNDLGRMGAFPSHPELLDWLAGRLRERGSLKRLHRELLTSATYQQSSQGEPQGLTRDAQGQWYWRYQRQRMDAEAFRDSLLSISGTDDSRMGGPSVRHFIQSPGVHVTPEVDYAAFDVDDPANHRRSVYRFIFRTIPDPFMEALDCPDASQLTPQRNESLTAIQALATLNDKFVVRQCEWIAQRLCSECEGLDDQVVRAYELVLGRAPDVEEHELAAAYAQEHGLANLARMLVNTNEFLFVD